MITAILDACVLYPWNLTNMWMWLMDRGAFRGKWTDQIHEEWIRNLLTDRPDLTREQLERRRVAMDDAEEDARVVGYEHLVSGLSLPDADDRHVLAAAIHCEADGIVTFNLSDFPLEELSPHGLEIWHPDELLCELSDRDPDAVCEAFERHRTRHRRVVPSIEEALESFRNQQVPRFAERMRELVGRD